MKSTNVQTLGALRMCGTANNGLELMGMHLHMVLAMLLALGEWPATLHAEVYTCPSLCLHLQGTESKQIWSKVKPSAIMHVGLFACFHSLNFRLA